MCAVPGQHPENASTCRAPVHAVNEIRKDALSNICPRGQGKGLQIAALVLTEAAHGWQTARGQNVPDASLHKP